MEWEEWKQQERNRSTWSRVRYAHPGPFKMPFEYGPIGALQSFAHVTTMDAMLDGKVTLSRINDIANARAPSFKEALGNLPIPMQFKTGYEIALNYKFFFDEPVVAHRLRDMYPDSPHLQTWPDTPELYKTAGRTIGVSPDQIRHATRGILTSLGDDLVGVVSRAIHGKRVFGNEAADLPLIGRLMSREARGFASKPVQDLRELVRERDALLGEIKDHKRRGVDTSALEEQVKQLTLARVMDTLVEDAWDAAKEERESASPNPELAMEHERQMTDLAARFFELVDGKATDDKLRQRLDLSVITAVSRIGTPQQQDDESDEDFTRRVATADKRRDRLFTARSIVAAPIKIRGELTEQEQEINIILGRAANTLTEKPTGQRWSTRWARESGQGQLLAHSGLSYSDIKTLLARTLRKNKMSLTNARQQRLGSWFRAQKKNSQD